MQKNNRTSARKSNKAQKATPRFYAKVNDLKKTSLILVNLNEAPAFVDACNKAGVPVRVGNRYKDGLIIIKK